MCILIETDLAINSARILYKSPTNKLGEPEIKQRGILTDDLKISDI